MLRQLLLTLVIVLVLPGQLYACCGCMYQEYNLKNFLAKYDFVFTGKVVSVARYDNSPAQYIEDKYIITVATSYKGKKCVKEYTLITGGERNSCGYKFEVGREYLIYATRHTKFKSEKKTGFLETSICTPTKPYNEKEAKELEQLSGRKQKNKKA